jgi:hypothetical protein
VTVSTAGIECTGRDRREDGWSALTANQVEVGTVAATLSRFCYQV